MNSGIVALIVAALTATYSYGVLNGTIKALLEDIKELQKENKEIREELADLRIEIFGR